MALSRRDAGKLTIWLFRVDNTRIVPPDARNVTSYPARSREELERHILALLEQAQNLRSGLKSCALPPSPVVGEVQNAQSAELKSDSTPRPVQWPPDAAVLVELS